MRSSPSSMGSASLKGFCRGYKQLPDQPVPTSLISEEDVGVGSLQTVQRHQRFSHHFSIRAPVDSVQPL